jgi:hypothetical protein
MSGEKRGARWEDAGRPNRLGDEVYRGTRLRGFHWAAAARQIPRDGTAQALFDHTLNGFTPKCDVYKMRICTIFLDFLQLSRALVYVKNGLIGPKLGCLEDSRRGSGMSLTVS